MNTVKLYVHMYYNKFTYMHTFFEKKNERIS